MAAEIANTYTKVFVAEQQNKNHRYYASALRLVDRQPAALSPKERVGTAGLALQDRAQSLGVLAELRNGNVEVAQAAAGRTRGAALPPGEAESFHLLRAHLRYFNVDRELRTVLVASAGPGDGKTTIVRHLAVAAAGMGSRVLLYDLVVVDTPPLTAVSDAFPLLAKVDGVIVVGRLGRNRRDVARRLHETLTGAGAPLLGVVANGLEAGRFDSYGYGYGGSYAPAAPERPSAPGASPNGAAPAEEPVPAAKA
jgi:Mrp family chromosome partitioning ATPase